MSPKIPARDPRIAPKEMIVTRRKSAQQKRQLRDKDRSMKSITQLLKSPTRSAPSPKKAKASPKKSPKKKLLPEPAKRDPQPAERRQKTERVWLKPKHNFKMVARTNKRKLCTPHREIDRPTSRSRCIEQSVSPGSKEPLDMMQLIEETDSLDDEDLMEILTCPSPVWWEDPPDPWYSEKAICTRSPNLFSQELEKQKEKTKTVDTTNKKSMKSNVKQDPKFEKKRNKLEDVLGSIKNKKNIQNDDDDKSDVDCELINDEMLKTLENMDIPIEPEFDKNNIKIEKKDLPNKKKQSNVIKIKKKYEINKINPKLDQNKRKDVMPVKVPENLPPLQRNPMHPESILENPNLARRNTICTPQDSNDSEILPGNSSNIYTKSDLAQMNLNLTSNVSEKDQVINNEVASLENNEILQGNSVIQNNEIKRNSANSTPELHKSESKDLDTISDTNVKFIDKVEDKELDDTSQMILDKIKKFFQDKDKEKKMKQKEYITVYKIVDNEEKSEIRNDDQSKINYFYKKCKNVRKKNENKEVDSKEYVNKTLALPNSQVKYCFRCSCIFETKECHYCAMSQETRECVCDKSQENRSDLSCDNCDATDKSEHVNCKSK